MRLYNFVRRGVGEINPVLARKPQNLKAAPTDIVSLETSARRDSGQSAPSFKPVHLTSFGAISP